MWRARKPRSARINVYSDKPELLCIDHGHGGDDSPSLAEHLDGLHELVFSYPNLSLVVFDCKESVTTADFGLEILTEIRNRLTHDTNISVILSVAEFSHTKLFDRIARDLRPREGLMIDYENDVGAVVRHFNRRGVVNQTYGNGISVANRIIGPYYRYSHEAACTVRAQIGVPKFVCARTVNTKEGMREYIDIGVDGIITDDIDDLKSVLGEPGYAALVRLGNWGDNPLNPPNHAYGLTIHTTDKWNAGTDAHVTFTLVGTKGMVSKTVDTELVNRMEAGDWNHVMIPSDDLGKLVSITVRRDNSGNAPDWHLDRITVASERYNVRVEAVFDRWFNDTEQQTVLF